MVCFLSRNMGGNKIKVILINEGPAGQVQGSVPDDSFWGESVLERWKVCCLVSNNHRNRKKENYYNVNLLEKIKCCSV